MIGTTILEERKSKYNGDLRVVKTFGMGTYIQANGLTQSGGIVKTIWKQTLNKVKKMRPIINSSLILGFGGGTVSKLIDKKWPAVSIKGIDIDPLIVEMGEKYLGSINSTNTEVKIGDALKELKNINDKYDLIVVDLYNGDNYPEAFETNDFMTLAKKHLTPKGLVVFNRLYYGDKRPQAVKFGNKLKKIYSDVKWFYPEANLMFVCSS